MAQSLWKGGIDFALVHIPVSLHSAEKSDEEVSFRLLDGRDHARIRYTRVNENTGQEVDWDEIVKGYEYEPEKYVVLSDDDFKAAAARVTASIEIDCFVELSEVDVAAYEKPYYLVPGKGGEKGYVLLTAVLQKSKKAAVARFVLRNKEHICLVVPKGPALQLLVLRYASELRSPEEAGVPTGVLSEIKPSARELGIAAQLVDQMTEEWEPERYKNRYQESLRAIIQERMQGIKPKTKKVASQKAGKVIDMVALLEKSLKSSKPEPKRKGDRKRA